MLKHILLAFGVMTFALAGETQNIQQTKGDFVDKFRQLDEVLPTPNVYRNAAGAPGHQYWQQQADYDIEVTLDEPARRISAHADITYQNNSPDTLIYLWLQLDQNRFRPDSLAERSQDFSGRAAPGTLNAAASPTPSISLSQLRRLQALDDTAYGYRLGEVLDERGEPLEATVVDTLMRIDLPRPLRSGQSVRFSLDWSYNLVDHAAVGGRAGYEHFPDDEREGGNDIFLVAQWFPRLVAYTDYEGWHNKAFLGRGEFTLEFGNYEVEITVPDDHIVSATGELQNARQVLTARQRARLTEAASADHPVFIVSPEEALAAESSQPEGTKTWRFRADNVRDYAWASSRKFAWDAQGHRQPGAEHDTVMAMSFYPKEGGELWQKYSTAAVIHTLDVYSRFSFDYPYPTAQSVNGPVGGMEYPMITFNGPRTTLQEDGSRTYSMAEKVFLVGVVIHEIGHIYFPMVVNSDERQWTWMDEGINSFLDSVAGYEWDPDMPWTRSLPRDLIYYMVSENQVPIMTQSDSVRNLGPNAYGKPSAALHILRETVMGRELFDFAFREYARRWRFKRPTPSDFFRTMEEASGVDLDWFWHGWFYTTDHVDMAMEDIKWMQMDSQDPDVEAAFRQAADEREPKDITQMRNADGGVPVSYLEADPTLNDYYTTTGKYEVLELDRQESRETLEGMSEEDRALLNSGKQYYEITFRNVGGLVMPLILEFEYEDGEREVRRIPAEIWKMSEPTVTKVFVTDRPAVRITLDPYMETADVDMGNNVWPPRPEPTRFEVFQGGGYSRYGGGGENPMQRARRDAEQNGASEE